MNSNKDYPVCKEHPYSGFRLENKWGKCACAKCGKHIGWVDPTDINLKYALKLMRRPECPKCGQTGSVHLMRTIQINGNNLVKWHCEACEKFASNPLPHEAVLIYLEYLRQCLPERREIPSTIEEISTKRDYRTGEPCLICGSMQGTEFHHFLPRVFRHDPRVAPHWETWQTCGVNLCRDCHELWHELVAPMALLASAGVGK